MIRRANQFFTNPVSLSLFFFCFLLHLDEGENERERESLDSSLIEPLYYAALDATP